MGDRRVRRVIVVTGVVQGVGMRPFVARLARELGLAGWCANTPSHVRVEVEGPAEAVAAFERRLVLEAPPLAAIASVTAHQVPLGGGDAFVIVDSAPDGGSRTLVAPDTAPCADCLREFADPGDRRYRHPFITCTSCGPRFTITLDLPYDRPATTMAGFPMCARCAEEYADPDDRRYHAQPIACHDCGPTLALRDTDGRVVTDTLDDVVDGMRRHLADGRIVAIKGLGGYHLACDAADPTAVARLRTRKHRPHQPFAVMVPDLSAAEALVETSPGARALLTAAARPIVLLRRRAHPAGRAVCAEVAPGLDDLGLLLPYTPVHLLLFSPADGPGALVMTSGNRSGEPLCVTEEEAFRRLDGIADAFVTHDRPIAVPCEDSVMSLDADDRPLPVRRSRGYAPLPVTLPAAPHEHVVLATGAELKNTVTLVRDGLAFVSAHVGDLATLESREAYERALTQATRFHRASPTLVVADRHPGYHSRAWAAQRAADLDVPLLEVQHHHAHLAALAAEHDRLAEPLVGLVFDGTGYGCDATVWGGELLALRDGGRAATRLGHLHVLPLPGGDAGVRHPARMAAAAMLAAGVALDPGAPAVDALTDRERRVLPRLLDGASGWVATSSVGRLFDVVASMLGVRHHVTYEAQAAIELEACAVRWGRLASPAERAAARALLPPLPTTTPAAATAEEDPAAAGPSRLLDPRPGIRAIDGAVRAGVDRGSLAWAFHAVLAEGAADLGAHGAAVEGLDVVALTGGVFQNRLLTALLRDALVARRLRVLTHRVVPPNDGGISLGQAAVGVAALAAGGLPRQAGQ
jgi:hydrogenase maturation protein HypF